MEEGEGGGSTWTASTSCWESSRTGWAGGGRWVSAAAGRAGRGGASTSSSPGS